MYGPLFSNLRHLKLLFAVLRETKTEAFSDGVGGLLAVLTLSLVFKAFKFTRSRLSSKRRCSNASFADDLYPSSISIGNFVALSEFARSSKSRRFFPDPYRRRWPSRATCRNSSSYHHHPPTPLKHTSLLDPAARQSLTLDLLDSQWAWLAPIGAASPTQDDALPLNCLRVFFGRVGLLQSPMGLVYVLHRGANSWAAAQGELSFPQNQR